MKVRDVMTTKVVTVAPETPFKELIERLVRSEVSAAPVVDADRIATDVENALNQDPNRPDDFHVEVSVARGMVTVRGDVRYVWDEPVVLAIVRAVPGVIDVVSELHHREQRARTPSEAWTFDPR
jgi:osmotically-inducible protein OsmY